MDVLGRVVGPVRTTLARFVQEVKHTANGSYLSVGCGRLYPPHDAEVARLVSIFPNLTRLNLTYCGSMEDQNLHAIVEKCRSLEELSITTCDNITSTGIINILPFLKNLRQLDRFDVLNLGDDCLGDIARMCPLLEHLDLSGTRVTRTGVSSIMNLATNLTTLNMMKDRGISSSDMGAIMEEKPPHVTITHHDRYDIYADIGPDAFFW
ncbi:hypothetical protein DFS34DRAFT_247819 [Phlyctochytrium arcticum]|nr:hypothetical protein DFS34DRAFT_247819 [Phlyctochytrium arcticum]